MIRLRSVADFVLITVALALLLVWPLRSPLIGEHGEAREGLVVQDIVQNHRWVLPYRNGELPSKPPLFHWVAAVSAGAFGLSDTTVRLPSALAAWVMAAVTFALGVTIGGRLTGWLAIGALLGMHSFWMSAVEARVDMVFAAAVTVSIAGFFFWYRSRNRSARALCYLAAACAVLAKGPAGGLLVGLVVFAFLSVQREWGLLRQFWSWPLAATVFVIDVGWYGLAYRADGSAFLHKQLLQENLDRLMGTGQFSVQRTSGIRHAYEPPLALATQLLPWSLALGWAAFRWARGQREDAAGRFLHVWWLAILVCFSVASGKRAIYLLPLYPAVALIAGRALAAVYSETSGTQRLFGIVPVPARLRRLFPARPALALLVVLIVLFDTTLLTTSQIVRAYQAPRHSLATFANEVGHLVPAGAPLYADPLLAGEEVITLAYRLRRPIGPEQTPGNDQAYYLVPAAAIGERTQARYQLLTVSTRRDDNVALMRRSLGD